jgi:hypothetical protein
MGFLKFSVHLLPYLVRKRKLFSVVSDPDPVDPLIIGLLNPDLN